MEVSAVLRQKLLIGIGCGFTAMIICTGLMFLILIMRQRYLDKDDKYLARVAMANNIPPSALGIDMTRSIAWSHRQGFRRSESRGPSLTDSPYDPTLRPLHGQNDPFFHRERALQSAPYSHSGSPRDSYSDRSGRIAIVPFRESSLPSAPGTTYREDGHLNDRVLSGRSSPREDYPGAPSRHHRQSSRHGGGGGGRGGGFELASLGFDEELFDLAAGRRSSNHHRHTSNHHHYRDRANNNRISRDSRSSGDSPRENSPLHTRRDSPLHSDGTHLDEVYY